MKSEKLLGEELLTMQKEKGKICVSIIVPTHRLSPERRVDKLEVERALDNARQFLQFKYAEPNIKPLLQALDELYQDIDFPHVGASIRLCHIKNYNLIKIIVILQKNLLQLVCSPILSPLLLSRASTSGRLR